MAQQAPRALQNKQVTVLCRHRARLEQRASDLCEHKVPCVRLCASLSDSHRDVGQAEDSQMKVWSHAPEPGTT